ncbi:Vms1p [Rhodotorula paludigena]|uniref:Vms1p n=1 Tax=Rhodotorula paludigena TaxID=86838 RepID=UPI0031740EBE
MAHKLAPSALYCFQLPPALLDALRPRQLVLPDDHPLNARRQPENDPAHEPAPTPAPARGSYTCALTGASFPTLDGLKQHYHSDWYRYNAKLKLEGKPTPVSEDHFNRLIDNLTDSISGSDSSSDGASSASASDAESDTNLSRLLRKQHLSSASRPSPGTANAVAADDDEADELDAAALSGPRSSLQWFEAPAYAPETQYGLARAALPAAGARRRALPGPGEEGRAVLDELRELQLAPSPTPGDDGRATERKWTLLMFGGGHFAGMVVQLRPKLVSRGKGKDKEREIVVLEKKTFHRYTTRRKQGGSQGANDSANGKAKSAGAMIRRYNEAMLNDEVRALLSDWRDDIAASELVFLRCSKNNYKTFFGYADDAPLQKGDQRVRGFGFPTKRPTINELMRSFMELTRLKVSHLSAEALAQLDADYLASITPAAPAPKPASTAPPPSTAPATPAPPKLSKLEALERDRWLRLVDMVRKGRLDALVAFLDKYGPELESGEGSPWGSLPAWMDDARAQPTLLHVASAADQPRVVRYLLEDKRADPCALSAAAAPAGGAAGRTPYELAGSRATRNEFRFVAFAHPDWVDWLGGARVPSGLDERVEREKERREAERREKARERERVREEERAREDERVREAQERARVDERNAALLAAGSRGGPQRLGGGAPAPIRDRDRAGLSEEQKMRIMREERARAAEARLKRLGG